MIIVVGVALLIAVVAYFSSQNKNGQKNIQKSSEQTKESPQRGGNSTNTSIPINDPIKDPKLAVSSVFNNTPVSDIQIPSKLGNMLRVDYFKPTTKYVNGRTFPFVTFPEYNVLIKPPVKGKRGNKGVTEARFCIDYLVKHFANCISDNLTLFAGVILYEPDITYFGLRTKNIIIDIEIDEPYEGVIRRPTHYLMPSGATFDDSRNKLFNERGWIVLRFSERQIFSNPSGCCRTLCDILKLIEPGFSLPYELTNISPVSEEKMWTYDEAEKMALNKVREKYLGINEFNNSLITRQLTLIDSQIGKEIEKQIIQKIQPATVQKTIFTAAAVITTTKTVDSTARVTTNTTTPSTPAAKPYAKNPK